MCYKDESQRELVIKFEEKSKSLPDFIKDYFVFLESGNTKINNLSNILKFFEWLNNQNVIRNAPHNITVDDLRLVTDVHIVKYLDGLKNGLYGSSIKNSSACTKMNSIRGLWTYLIDKEYVTKNIVTKSVSSKYKVKDKKVEVPTEDDVNNLIKSFEQIKNEEIALMYIAIAKLFLGSGIRLDELVGLDIDDLYFDNPNDRYVMVMEKGEYDEQEKVNINQAAYFALADYLRVRNLKPENKDIKALFVSSKGQRLSEKTIQNMFSTHSSKKIHPHLLRHYVGTKIYQNSGYDINKVQKQLRHKNINTSIKYYVADDQEDLKNVLDSF